MKSGHFHMSRGDRLYLLFVLIFALGALLPWSRGVMVGGMALQGWLMAALMVLAPAVALARLARGRRRKPPA